MNARILKILSILLALSTYGPLAWSAESPLGSPSKSVKRYSDNYADVVRSALPPVKAGQLDRMLEEARRAGADEKPLAIAQPRRLESFFGLRQRGDADASGFIDAGDSVYRVDTERQRIYVAWRNRGASNRPREEFKGELAAITSAHRELAERIGIPRGEVLFTDTREILSETDGHPVAEKGVMGEIRSEGAMTTILRSVGGILVEDSYARFSSIDAKQLDLVNVQWPPLRVSESAMKKGLREPREALERITRRIASESKGEAVNVRMAIVLRPVAADTKDYPIEFVPSLKVGTRPKSMRTKDGYRTDAGEVFYVDLVRDAPPFADASTPDTKQSEEPR